MKRSSIKRKSKSNKKKIMQELDDLVSRITRKIGYCLRCGKSDNLQAHHIVRRSRSTVLRWDLRNLMCLCRGCHFWWHNSATKFDMDELCARCLTEEDEAHLKENQHKESHFSVSDLEDMLKRIKEENE